MGKRKKSTLQMGMSAVASGPTSKQLTLPERVVEFAGRGFDDFWRIAEQVRRKPELLVGGHGAWQPWCYLPVNAVTGIAAHLVQDEYTLDDVEMQLSSATRLLTATCAWRMTKGVYIFDPEVLKALVETRADEEPPHEMFLHLPEWCPYIATPGLEVMEGVAVHGFFAYVDDRNHGASRHYAPELNFEILIDPANSPNDDHLFMVGVGDLSVLAEASEDRDPSADLRQRVLEVCRSREFVHSRTNVPLGGGSFLAATTEHLQGVLNNPKTPFHATASKTPEQDRNEVMAYFAQMHARLGSLLLYLVSDRADVDAAAGNAMQSVVANERRGARTYPARQIHQWEVGYRIGAQIRAFEASTPSAGPDGSGSSVRPHVRKAHWHSFWTGPRDQPEKRKKRVRWLPPIPVNVEGSESLVPTVHRVVTGSVH